MKVPNPTWVNHPGYPQRNVTIQSVNHILGKVVCFDYSSCDALVHAWNQSPMRIDQSLKKVADLPLVTVALTCASD